jgi:hypothetical protein
MEPFDRIGGARALPLADRQPGKREEPIPGFLEAVGHRLHLSRHLRMKARRRSSISAAEAA